jgi:hypothetical protein
MRELKTIGLEKAQSLLKKYYDTFTFAEKTLLLGC